MKIKNLSDLFLNELKDIYDAEHRIARALGEMIEVATTDELVALFQEHQRETGEQISRLEKVFALIDEKPERKTCEATKGLIAETKELIEEVDDDIVINASLVAAAQKVEHYEIATYGSLRTWAQILEHDEASTLLQATLDEEGRADERLTAVAKTLNPAAV